MTPLTYFLIYLLTGLGLHVLIPFKIILDSPYIFIGVILLIIGGWLNVWTDRIMKRYKTPVNIFKNPTSLIVDGPFAFSRNPMYLGMIIMLFGIAILLGSIAAFSAPVLFFVTANSDFIPKEEKQLKKKFGEKYEEYCKDVRRWL